MAIIKKGTFIRVEEDDGEEYYAVVGADFNDRSARNVDIIRDKFSKQPTDTEIDTIIDNRRKNRSLTGLKYRLLEPNESPIESKDVI